MEVFKIIGYALIAVIMIVIVKEYNKEQAIMMRLATCCMIFFMLLNKLEVLKEYISEFEKLHFESNAYIGIVLKVIAIAYLVEIAAEISKDAGEGSISSNIMIAGKFLILYVASPVIRVFITQMITLIN